MMHPIQKKKRQMTMLNKKVKILKISDLSKLIEL